MHRSALLLPGLAAGVIATVVALLALASGDDTTYRLRMLDAGQLVVGNDVQVGGRRIGSVRRIALTPDHRAEITIAVSGEVAPLHQGTRARVRATSLSGVANRYVSLAPGPNSAAVLPDGAVLGLDRTTSPVDLDRLFATFDDRTRARLRDVIRGSADQVRGRGRQGNAAARYAGPALSSASGLVAEVLRDEGTFEDVLVSSSRVLDAVAQRRADVTALVGHAGAAAGAIGAEERALRRGLGRLPGALRQATTTLERVRPALDDLDALTDVALPATRRLPAFLGELRPLVTDARPAIADLRRVVRRAGAADDLTDLTRRMPRLARVARPALAATTRALRDGTPVLDFARPYTPDLAGWLRDFGQAAANYDANGHFARVQPVFNAFGFTDDAQGGTLRAIDPARRLEGLQTGVVRRCPGAATQRPADGSAPFTDDGLDCDPGLVLPGG